MLQEAGYFEVVSPKKIAIFTILLYKKLLSPFFGRSCRFYPTCSEYGVWQFENNSFFKAFFLTLIRVVRCSPLTDGGVDYPVVKKGELQKEILKQKEIRDEEIDKTIYWLIPSGEKRDRFIAIKRFKKSV